MYTKLIFILLFLSTIPVSLSAQDTTFYDDDWNEVKRMKDATYYGFLKKEGKKWILKDYYASTGDLQSEGAYKSKKKEVRVGPWTYYFENGNKEKEINYVADKYHGYYQEWYESGEIFKKGNYEEGKKIGIWKSWFLNGSLSEEVDYEKGLEWPKILNTWARDGSQKVVDGNGEYRNYWPDKKQLRYHGLVENKDRIGLWKVYYESGELYEELAYQNGVVEGVNISYFKNGEKAAQGSYAKGKAAGVWQFFNQEGAAVKISTYPIEEGSGTGFSHILGNRAPFPVNVDAIKLKVGYPQSAIIRGLQDQIIIQVLIDKEGKYVKHKIKKTGHRTFLNAINAQIDQIVFTPAFKEAETIKFWVNIPFNFTLID